MQNVDGRDDVFTISIECGTLLRSVAGYRLRWELLFHQLWLQASSLWHAPSKLKEGQPGHSTTNYKLVLYYTFSTCCFISAFCSN